jgi:hypothetical protein
LRVKVEGNGYDIEVTGTFAVSEKGALDAVSSGKEAEFCCRDAGTTVIVGMEADDCFFAFRKIATEPFNLIGVNIWRGPFNSRRQVEYDFVVNSGLPDVHDASANIESVVDLGVGKTFRRIFQADLGAGDAVLQFADQLCTLHRDRFDLFFALIKSDTALKRRGRVVEMDDCLPTALETFKCAPDKVLTGLYKNLYRDVFRDAVFFDEASDEAELGITG